MGAAEYIAALMAYSPAGLWMLNDAPGSTLAKDISGSGNHGTIQPPPPADGVSLWRTSPFPASRSPAAAFDGSTGYVSVPNAASLNVGTGPFTVGFWFKVANGGGNTAADAIGVTGDYSGNWWVAGSGPTNAGQILFAGADAGNVHQYNRNTTTAFNDGNWHLAIIPVDRVSQIPIYVDAVSQPTQDGGGNNLTLAGVNLTNPNILGIGLTQALDTPWAGSLAGAFLIVGTALTAAQIQALYTAALLNPTAKPPWNPLDDGIPW